MSYSNTVLWNVTYGVVAVCTTVCNLLFLVVYSNSHRLMRMRVSLLLISLTAADLIVGAVVIPMYMVILWPGSEVGKSRALERSCEIIDVVSGFASLFGLTVIALERVYSVFWPYKHRASSKAPYFLASLSSWLVAALQLILLLLQWNSVLTARQVFYCFFPFMTVPMIVIIVSYFIVWMKIRLNRNDAGQRTVERESKLAFTLTILTGVFLVTWLPFYSLNTVVNLCVSCVDRMSRHFIHAAKFLHYSNSLANPVIYSLRLPDVRRTLSRMLCRHRRIIVAPASIQVTARRQCGSAIPKRVERKSQKRRACQPRETSVTARRNKRDSQDKRA